jgi:hypothetical protein
MPKSLSLLMTSVLPPSRTATPSILSWENSVRLGSTAASTASMSTSSVELTTWMPSALNVACDASVSSPTVSASMLLPPM